MSFHCLIAHPVSKCPCPGEPGSNRSFSSNCVVGEDNSVECIGCPVGFDGKQCERCAPGYFGDPSSGVPCSLCLCNGNVNPSDPNRCNTTTGECNCHGNTAGRHCEVCRPGTWGNALTGECRGGLLHTDHVLTRFHAGEAGIATLVNSFNYHSHYFCPYYANND